MKNKIIKINDGISIDLEINRAIISPLFSHYDPFTNKFYSDLEFKNDLHLDFEENDDGEFICVSNSFDLDLNHISHSKISGLSLDVAHIMKGILNGMAFAIGNLFAFRWESALEIAKDLGYHNGKGSAEWICMDIIGGRSKGNPIPLAKRILKMYDDGDPEIYDMIPMSPLSGEWSDQTSGSEIICDSLKINYDQLDELQTIADALGMECEFDSLKGTICRTYEESYSDSCIQEIVDQCKSTIS